MFNCKKIQDLILTDYMDERVNEDLKKQIDDHLIQCEVCQKFAKDAKEFLVVPFQEASRQEVPSQIWENIKENISKEQAKPSLGELLGEWLKGFSFPQMVPALASFVMCVFITSTVFFDWKAKQAQDQEQGAYVEYMLSSATTNQRDNQDWGTPIEQYFL